MCLTIRDRGKHTQPVTGCLKLTYVGHATALIEVDGVRLLTDPLLRSYVGPLHRHAPPIHPDWTQGIQAVLISHLHRDHLDIPSLLSLDRSTTLVVPRGAGRLLRQAGFCRVIETEAGEATRVENIVVKSLPAHHAGFRAPFGPSGDCLGFLVEATQNVYFSGDTGIFAEMKDFAPRIDLALLPVWGWGPTLGDGHMDPVDAAEALTLLEPRIAIPIHWGALSPFGVRWLRPKYLTHPPHVFSQEASRVAPSVEVRILSPGDSTTIAPLSP